MGSPHASRGAVVPSLPPTDLGHRPALDGLRGLAVFAVMFFHGYGDVIPGGFIGVDVFFVLSGFLITTLLLQEHRRTGAIDLRQFYLRRVLRLLPAVLALLVVCWGVAMLYGSAADRVTLRRDTISTLLYYHNWRLTGAGPLTGFALRPLWSLSLEEQFYFVWPVLLSGLLALGSRRSVLAGATLLLILIPTALRVTASQPATIWIRLYHGSFTRADALGWGCLLGILFSAGYQPRSAAFRLGLRFAAWAAAACLVYAFFRFDVRDSALYYTGMTALGSATMVLIAALLWSPPPVIEGLLVSRPLRWLGMISYGAYLWNHPVIFSSGVIRTNLYAALVGTKLKALVSLADLLPRYPKASQLALTISFSILAGGLSFFLVERPFLRLKGRLRKRAAAPERTEAESQTVREEPSLPFNPARPPHGHVPAVHPG